MNALEGKMLRLARLVIPPNDRYNLYKLVEGLATPDVEGIKAMKGLAEQGKIKIVNSWVYLVDEEKTGTTRGTTAD